MEDSQPTDKDYEIKSVKRLSDGKVFSAGEKYDGYSIMHFEERDGKLLVAITDKEFKSPGLSVLMHLKNL